MKARYSFIIWIVGLVILLTNYGALHERIIGVPVHRLDLNNWDIGSINVQGTWSKISTDSTAINTGYISCLKEKGTCLEIITEVTRPLESEFYRELKTYAYEAEILDWTDESIAFQISDVCTKRSVSINRTTEIVTAKGEPTQDEECEIGQSGYNHALIDGRAKIIKYQDEALDDRFVTLMVWSFLCLSLGVFTKSRNTQPSA